MPLPNLLECVSLLAQQALRIHRVMPPEHVEELKAFEAFLAADTLHAFLWQWRA